MLLEALLHIITPVPRSLRRMGLLRDSIALWSRGARRRRDWRPHEARSHDAVRQAVATVARRRKAVVLGSGLVRDIPLADLVETFEEVILVDAVHLPFVRARMALQPKVRLLTRDLTGLADWLAGTTQERADPLADLAADPTVDFVLSANVLSQLPLGVESFLEANPARAAALPQDIADRTVADHLADLGRFRGAVCLLTDVEMREEDRQGLVVDRLDLMRGHVLPPPFTSWDWTVAPFGEIERDRRYVHRVHVSWR
jgi:ethanolamine utilization microcompartment shell protein EutS